MVSNDISVVDCSTIVPPTPNKKPLKGVAVLRSNSCSKRPPASCFKPSSRHCIPNKNKAKPAHSCNQPELYQKLLAKTVSANTGNTNDLSLSIHSPKRRRLIKNFYSVHSL